MFPLQKGLLCLLVVCMLYEPVRLALHRLDSDVGGVGGVGGLTNQWTCAEGRGTFGRDVCFHRGAFAGLTPFALVVFGLWTVPLAVTATISYVTNSKPTTTREMEGFQTLWMVLELLWFSVPAAAYLSDPFYRRDAWHVILGLAICAAFPLSWHLSLVAVPASGRGVLALLTGFSEFSLMSTHKLVAWSTVRWAALHVFGELVYVCAKDRGAFRLGPYRFIFWAGALTAAVFLVHVTFAYRRSRFLPKTFSGAHKAIAIATLLCATMHWWPFVFFLAPSVAVFATARAVERAERDAFSEYDAVSVSSLALATAMLATVCGVCAVWNVRQLVLFGAQRNLHRVVPYVFPPLALVFGYALARVAAAVAVIYCKIPRYASLLPETDT